MLNGQRAVVTGGGRGIGLAVAQALAEAGASVFLVGRDAGRLESAAASIGPAARWGAVDVTDEAALATVLAQAGPADILVNNAGGVDSRPVKRLTADDMRRSLDQNLMGAFHAGQVLLPGMVERGYGRIVNIASTAGQKGYAYAAHYCASKHALVGLTRAMAVELARTGVTVNAICPGYVATDLLESSLDNIQSKTGLSREDALARILTSNPQGRPVQAQEVAAAVLWLCSPGSGAVTGQSIGISGGEVT